jgi:hypothetical protein
MTNKEYFKSHEGVSVLLNTDIPLRLTFGIFYGRVIPFRFNIESVDGTKILFVGHVHLSTRSISTDFNYYNILDCKFNPADELVRWCPFLFRSVTQYRLWFYNIILALNTIIGKNPDMFNN